MWEAETENSLEACTAATLKHVVQQTLSKVKAESYSLTLSRDLHTHAVPSTGYHTIHTCAQPFYEKTWLLMVYICASLQWPVFLVLGGFPYF